MLFLFRRYALLATCLMMIAAANPAIAVEKVWQPVEITRTATGSYANPYMDVDCRIEVTGPGGTYVVPGFWDGGDTFRFRIVATEPGDWQWSISNDHGDSGLTGSGSFTAEGWSSSQLSANPNRRGHVRATANGHALEYADGTPYFFTSDTIWTALTRVWKWDSSGGVADMSFKNAIATRKNQGYNAIAFIACFPSDTTNGIWHSKTHGEKVSEAGDTPFHYSGSSPDYRSINPAYWQHADVKMQHLHEQGFVALLETVRRHESWRNESDADITLTRYVRYLWARYGCYNMIFSWLHWDFNFNQFDDWKPHVDAAAAALGDMPYDQVKTAMAYGSTLETWGDEAYLDAHVVSNRYRGPKDYPRLRDLWALNKPCFNLEPFYPGFKWNDSNDHDLDARAQMYLSPLNGGFAGHNWGSDYYAGVRNENGDPGKNMFTYSVSESMVHLHDFFRSSGGDYRHLVPAAPTNLDGGVDDYRGLALSVDHSWGMGFIAHGYNQVDLVGLPANASYQWDWWHVDNGGWISAGTVTADGNGRLAMPNFPNTNNASSSKDWAFRIVGDGSGNLVPIADAGPNQTVTDQDESASESVTLDGSGSSDGDGDALSYNWSIDGSVIATGVSPTVDLAIGSHSIVLTVDDGNGGSDTDTVTVSVVLPDGGSLPFGGTARAVPGLIEVEHFDEGGQNVAYFDTTSTNKGDSTLRDGEAVDLETTSDSGGGANLGYVEGGEWLQYTIDVATATTYQVGIRIAANTSTGSTAGQLHLELDGAAIGSTVDVPGTGGWQTWTTIDAGTVSLSAGTHTLRLVADTAGYNVNWLEFVEEGGNIAPTADAGPDRSVTLPDGASSVSVTMDGSGSSDPDGTITDWVWSVNDDGTLYAGEQVTIDLPLGTHTVHLAISDDDGADGFDSATVTVESSGGGTSNGAPVVDAGANQMIALPNDTVSLDGTVSDPDGDALTSTWSLSSGPGTVTFGDPNAVDTTATFSTDGIYVLELAASDGSLTSTDTVSITVEPEPTAGELPSPWVAEDVGDVAAPGSTSHSNGTWTVQGSGNDIWNQADEFHFVHQPITGDITITAQVQSLTDTNEWAKAGVMIRQSTAADSTHAMCVQTVDKGVFFQRRTSTGSSSSSIDTSGKAAPSWVRMQRSGSTLTASTSEDGSTWTVIGSVDIAMSDPIEIGLCVTAHNDGALCEAVFTDVVVDGSGTSNGAPVVDAGANQTIALPNDTVSLDGTVSDPDGDALTSTWSLSSGPGTVTFGDPNAVDTTATFSTDGIYVLELAASDGALTSTDTVSITVEPEPTAGEVVLAVVAGGGAYTAVDGTAYEADTGITSGGKTYSTSAAIGATEDDPVYQSERYGNFSYAAALPDGDYEITFQFAEIYWNGSGKRVFDVAVEGALVIDDLDIHVAAGGKDIAYEVVVPVTIADGVLDIDFITVKDNAKCSGLVVRTTAPTSNG